MSTIMRAKMRVNHVAGNGTSETLQLSAVCAPNYGADGHDEDNNFARWTPNANLSISINNPDLLGKLKLGDAFYVDFTPVPMKL